MRKDRFIDSLPECIPAMRTTVRKARLDHDTVSDLVQDVITSAIEDKLYTRINKDIRAFLCRAMRFAVQRHIEQAKQRGKYMMHIIDANDVSNITEECESEHAETTECPFCFVGVLNEYGACKLCSTILPNPARRIPALWEEVYSLKQEFQYEKKTDIKRALEKLTPLQHKLIKHTIMGNETLAEFAVTEGLSSTTLWREWKRAQFELQAYLADYSTRKLSKHGFEDMQACLN